MIRIISALLLACSSLAGLRAQDITRETMDRVKAATVFVRTTHHFPITGDEVTGTGSGFFISDSGHVMTNYHVVQPMVTAYGVNFPTPVKKVEVIRNSGRSDHQVLDARVIAVDKEHDLALLVIDPKGERFPSLELLAGKALVELTPVWVFGFPFGEEFSVLQRGPEISITKGSVTALRHDDRDRLEKVQLDAVVNRGNSGGPAVNAEGKVVGVVNMRYGDSRVNFAVPADFADSLVSGVRLDASMSSPSEVRIESPDGASVFVDWKRVKAAPGGTYPVANGHHTICVMRKGSESFLREWVVDGPKSLSVEMPPAREMTIGQVHVPEGPLDPAPVAEQLLAGDPPELLLHDDFEQRESLLEWEQNTGGTEKRTWFIDDGTLQQFESDGMLHGIFKGETGWSDYVVRARVRIGNEENDSRAGLVFRETADGFYLFRIHRETDRAQLAYHSKKPFGWFVIQEKKLERDIAGDWYEMAVYAAGSRIACFLDGELVFNTCADYSRKGRVGFYSVESKASFDDLAVFAAPPAEPVPEAGRCGLRSFWFSDYFNLESTWWYQYALPSGEPSPWAFSEGGCAVEFVDEKEHVAEFTRYRLRDFTMSLVVSVGEAEKESEFAILVRKAGDRLLRLEFSKGEEEIRLVAVDGKKRKVLKKRELGEEFFDNSNVLGLNVAEDFVKCEAFGSILLEYSGKGIPEEPGRIGFSARKVRLVLHQMTVNSVPEETED